MLSFLVLSDIETKARGQAQLAALATCEEVRRMHEQLEQFYRTPLCVRLTADRLASSRER
ncbi:hypothetical protein EAH84_14705 [Sphingomonas oligophenolica]|uniref:Uncharacterized protein n=1 Tax=Sphingomonas oligophenolica TaxID=301154 RepID=A0A502C3T0_9SPHN|nr:hypothetical protein EAH84_14705 [Sphingomonas oligophenolica]